MYKNILIVKLSAIGDVIHALPVASALKESYPKAKITWIVEKPAYNLLQNHPCIDEIIIFEKAKFKSGAGLIRSIKTLSAQLKARKFDLALDLQGLFKSAAISWLSRATRRLVYCNARELSHFIGERICGQYSEGHVVERYLDVARYLGCNIDSVNFLINFTDEDKVASEAIAQDAGVALTQKYVILAPGTNWSTKCWPTRYFANLTEQLYQNNVISVLVGAPSDVHLANEITAQAAVAPINLVGKTTLKQLAYIIKHSHGFIGGDTGPMHLAAAVGTPVVALFGPTDPGRNGPYGSNHVVITADVPCAGCWRRSCERDRECMNSIQPAAVLQAVMNVLHN